ncbi:hypothetical protein V6N13_094716 [Hibiscus sabdariffa]
MRVTLRVVLVRNSSIISGKRRTTARHRYPFPVTIPRSPPSFSSRRRRPTPLLSYHPLPFFFISQYSLITSGKKALDFTREPAVFLLASERKPWGSRAFSSSAYNCMTFAYYNFIGILLLSSSKA